MRNLIPQTFRKVAQAEGIKSSVQERSFS